MIVHSHPGLGGFVWGHGEPSVFILQKFKRSTNKLMVVHSHQGIGGFVGGTGSQVYSFYNNLEPFANRCAIRSIILSLIYKHLKKILNFNKNQK